MGYDNLTHKIPKKLHVILKIQFVIYFPFYWFLLYYVPFMPNYSFYFLK